jgi:pimeloyl-ACP methyl ester carboxylesterase
MLLSPLGVRVRSEGENEWDRFKAKSNEIKSTGMQPPSYLTKIFIKNMWDNRTSPFSIGKIMGKEAMRLIIDGYISRRHAILSENYKKVMADFIYHLLMNPSTSECGLMVLFSQDLQAHLPLGATNKLSNPELRVPVSFVFGDNDWMRFTEDDYGKEVVKATQQTQPENHFYICHISGHNLHTENPKGLTDAMKYFYLNIGSGDKSE